MTTVTKVFESEVLIRFPDCDPFNHLNNSRYIDYFINTREDHLLKYHDFNIYQLAKETGISWVVSKNQIAYLKPAMLMETVVISTTILRLGEKDILVEMHMYNKTKTTLKAVLWTNFVHINLATQKSQAHSAELIEKYTPFVNPLNDPTISFDKRVEELKTEMAAQFK